MKKLSPLIVFLFLASLSQAQVAKGWSRSPFEFKVFIENMGQFDGKNDLQGSQILYGVDNLGCEIYYTPTGLTYRIDKWGMPEKDYQKWVQLKASGPAKTPAEVNERTELKKSKILMSARVHMEWVGASPSVKIVPSEISKEYFNYGGNTPSECINNVKAYNKLTYKNLYPGIDAEYTFHEKTGTKYALIVHPGADVSKVKMKYTGMDNLSIDDKGNIRMQTCMGEIVDHAPVTFYSSNGKPIASSFSVSNNTVSFHLGAYDKGQTIVVDPWTTNPTFTATNKALDIENDAAGNAYVYGAQNPFKLRKYDVTGTALWTYNATALFNTTWFGYLATDFAGNSYISNGFANGMVQKISPAGAMLVSNTNIGTGFGGSVEIFNLCFNKAQTQLVAGNSPGGHGVGNLNTTTLTMTGLTNVGGTASEIRGMSCGATGNYYGLTVANGPPSKVIAFTPAFTPLWSVPSGYTTANFGYYAPAYTGWFVFGTTINPNSQHDIQATKCYVYTYNGDTLKKRNITNGALIASVKVVGGTASMNSGILVDSCENIYVGTGSGISKYDQNLAFITSVATAGAVYDIAFAPNQEIYAAGNALVASVAGLVQPCAQSNLTLGTSSTGAACNGSNGSATVTSVSGGIGPYTYTWSTGATTSTATGLSAGIYTVTVKDNSCVQMFKTTTIAVISAGGGTASITASTNVLCNGGSNGSATATMTGGTGTLTYSWNPGGQNTSTATGLTAGGYTVTVIDNNGCTSTASVNITQPTAVIASTSGVVNATCSTLGSATASGTGGTGSYTYSWSAGGQTTQTATGLVAGTYTLRVTDANGCSQTTTVNITGVATPTASVSSSVNATCTTLGNATASGAGGTGTYTYSWSAGAQTTQTATGLAAGSYTVTITDSNGCTATATVSITGAPGPTASISSSNNSTCLVQGSATATATGGAGSYTYSWSSGAQTTQTATGLGAGTYTVTITDSNGCTSTATVSITGTSSPTANASVVNVLCNGGATGSASVTGAGGTGTYTYLWSNNQSTQTATGLTAGTYTVVLSDNNGCTVTATATVTEPAALVVNTTGGNTCSAQSNGSASATGSGGTAGYNYSWSNGQLTQNATGLSAATYTVTVTDANNCSVSATVQITASVSPVILFSADDTVGCMPLCVNFTCTTTNIATYTWDFGDGTANGTTSPVNHCYKSSGAYNVTLTVTDNNGCTATLTKTGYITVHPNVSAAFTASPQPTTVLSPVITFTDMSTGGATKWDWSFGDLLKSTSTLQNPKFDYKDSGCYNVQLIADNQYGCPDTAQQVVCILGDYQLYAPNAFTPDGNGLNDTWNVKGVGIDPNFFELYIFDRWGNLIFKTTDLYQGWDGKANGGKDIAQIDVYVWKVFTRDFLGAKYSYIGHVSLVR